MEENARENPVERLNNVEALTTEDDDGEALDAVTAEAEDVRAMITEGNIEVLTIEYSPKWGGTLIEEEQENAEIEDIPSTSATNMEILAPWRRRRRSKEEIRASTPIRRKRTRSLTTTEAARARWATLEAQIEFPILRPKANDAPEELAAEEPQIEGLLYENGILKDKVQSLQK